MPVNANDPRVKRTWQLLMTAFMELIIFKWLSGEARASVTQEIVDATAHVISWGILGTAVQWSRSPQRRKAEAMARDVLAVVAAGLAPVMETDRGKFFIRRG